MTWVTNLIKYAFKMDAFKYRKKSGKWQYRKFFTWHDLHLEANVDCSIYNEEEKIQLNRREGNFGQTQRNVDLLKEYGIKLVNH